MPRPYPQQRQDGTRRDKTKRDKTAAALAKCQTGIDLNCTEPTGASPKKRVLHFELKSVWECFADGLVRRERGGLVKTSQNIATELKPRKSDNPLPDANLKSHPCSSSSSSSSSSLALQQQRLLRTWIPGRVGQLDSIRSSPRCRAPHEPWVLTCQCSLPHSWSQRSPGL